MKKGNNGYGTNRQKAIPRAAADYVRQLKILSSTGFHLFPKDWFSLLTNGLQLLKSSQSGYFCATGVHLLRKKISLLEIDGILLKIQKIL